MSSSVATFSPVMAATSVALGTTSLAFTNCKTKQRESPNPPPRASGDLDRLQNSAPKCPDRIGIVPTGVGPLQLSEKMK